jgi:hypothetical protein
MGWNSKPWRISRRNPNGLELQATTKLKWVGTWNSKRLQNSNGLELQATTKLKWAGTPSHGEFLGEIQTGRNSKPLKTQMGWNSKPSQNANSSELQAMTNFK